MLAIDLILDFSSTGDVAGGPTGTLRRLIERWSPEVFLPMECHAFVSGQAYDWLPAGPAIDRAPWPGETATTSPVTQLDGRAAMKASVVDDLPAGDDYLVQLIGGLRYVAPELSPAPAWYGRVAADGTARPTPTLLTLAYIDFHWSSNWREIRLCLPMLGYPLSGQLPRFDSEGRPFGQQPAQLVERNRRSVIEAFAHCASAIGLQPGEASWSVETEEGTPAPVHDAIAALLQEATTGRK
ncbi:hypothetical protein PWR63_35945 [Paraburkholderia sp. A2WS-5]|uniref:hypothetical protein n=1 Tax=unclassified Paraburkholderia TaxID=2615204 RepID=UPI003B7A4454